MEVPFRLVRRVAPEAAEAFLVFAAGPGPLAAACAGFGELPDIFEVRGGFVLIPRTPGVGAPPGTVRLRRQAGDLYVPVDADLLPALLSDEAAALTLDRGLVFLPGGTVLAFDPSTPVPVGRWLVPPEVRRVEWKPFPERPGRPDALSAIERPSPPVAAVIEILGGGAPDDARPLPGPGDGAAGGVPEDARPPTGSTFVRAVAGAGLAAAGLLAWLGKQLGAAGLARLGGDLARRALEHVPRLSEKVLGEQEAALREVLRQLQSGDVEKGLSRAPAAVADPDRPVRVGTDARLAPRDPRYSIRDLIGTGGGAATAWMGGGDVWAELAREYRRLAAEAAARGDHRRAAYLYGVLLRDLRSAANTLLAGGLFRDAALLFRDRLNDPRAAATAFEQAGDHDEAIRLYDRLGEYERAADLLLRLGEDDRAVSYYARAADRLAAGGRFVAAGDLMRVKAARRDAAIEWYQWGWRADGAEAVTCAERLLDECLAAEDRTGFAALLGEAEAGLAARPRDAGRLFNYALRTSADLLPVDARSDLADRVRLLFAAHLRTAATIGEAGALAGDLFPTERPWAAPVGRDATFAVRKRPAVPAHHDVTSPTVVRVTAGPVTAVAVVRGTFDLIVAGADGIVYWSMDEGRFVPVAPHGVRRITALSVSRRGEVVYAVVQGANGTWWLRCFSAGRAGPFRETAQHTLETGDNDHPAIYLQAEATFRAGAYQVAVATPVEYCTFVGPHLRVEPDNDTFSHDRGPIHLVTDAGHGMWCWEDGVMTRTGEHGSIVNRWSADWTPLGSVDWLAPAPSVLEIASIDRDGCVRWAKFDARDPDRVRSRQATVDHPRGYVAVCFLAPEILASVTAENEVHWLRATGDRLTVQAATTLAVPARVVALAARPDPSEVTAVLADGGAVRLRRP